MKTISVRQAKALVLQNAHPLGVETIPLGEALGRAPKGPLRSPHDYPLRDVSAMDGYAYLFRSARLGSGLQLVGERNAGDAPGKKAKPGEAVRIMTGAPLPPGADTVSPKEQVRVKNGRVFIMGGLKSGSHVRRKGEGIRRGQRITLPPGPLTDRALGFLASLGISRVTVRRNPKVSILITGNELVGSGKDPGEGGVFESNGIMLRSALKVLGVEPRVEWIGDDPLSMERAVKRALEKSDILLTTGGVSVGERDHAKEAFAQAGVQKLFWRVHQKPGGPLYFGHKGRVGVFGLPGNPAAVYSCFRLYVQPLVRRLQGFPPPRAFRVHLMKPIQPLPQKTFFVKASLEKHGKKTEAKILSGQGSHLLESLVQGDGLLEVPPGRRTLGRLSSLLFHPFLEESI